MSCEVTERLTDKNIFFYCMLTPNNVALLMITTTVGYDGWIILL